jgi:hypothetical protein
MPLEMVRGGSVCSQDQLAGAAHLLQGSGGAAVCMPTLGRDSRSRWRKAGSLTSGSQLVSRRASRHSTGAEQRARGAAGRAERSRRGQE